MSPRRLPPKLAAKLLGAAIYAAVSFAVPLGLGAWTLRWWRGWVLVGVVFVAALVTMFGIFPSRPDLLEERLKGPIQKGQPLADKIVTPILVGSFLGLVAFCPVDALHLHHLLGGTGLAAAALGLVLFAGGWTLVALALRENAFAAPVVKHQAARGQFVVRTGPYAIVRHPMYAGAVPLMIGMALWLGSVAGVLASAVPLGAIVARIATEERLLRRDLPGYEEYARRVRWRLVPLVY